MRKSAAAAPLLMDYIRFTVSQECSRPALVYSMFLIYPVFISLRLSVLHDFSRGVPAAAAGAELSCMRDGCYNAVRPRNFILFSEYL